MRATALGLAVEAALKFSLAKVNLVRLADTTRGRGASGVLLALSARESIPVSELRTVNGMAAYEIFSAVHSGHKRLPLRKDVEQVLNVRNAAIHMGLVDPAELRASARSAVLVIERILFELEDHDEEAEEFWNEDLVELVYELADQKSSEIAVSLAAKRAAAFNRLAQLRQTAGEGWEIVRGAIVATHPQWDGVQFKGHPCPVCNAEGVLTREVTRSNLDFTGASYPNEQPSGYRYAYPESFECFVCGLALDQEEIDVERAFEEVLEEEVEPSDEFYRALEDWQNEERAAQLREASREDWLDHMREEEQQWNGEI